MKIIIGALLLFGAPSVQAAIPLDPGLYEVVTELELPKGAPAPKRPLKNLVIQQCIKSSDLKGPNPLGDLIKQPGCKIVDPRVEGNKLNWKLTCNSGLATGKGTAVLQGSRFHGEGSSVTKLRGAPSFVIKFKYSGRKIKDCS